MYFKALTNGLVNIPNIPIKFRKDIRSLYKKLGSKKFYSKLLDIDPLVKKINLHDTQRVLRAYEIKSYTKKSMYDWIKNTKPEYENDDFYKIYIDFPRGRLIKRINVRTQEMINKGAILEVKKFLKLKIQSSKTAYKAIGIREIKQFINKKVDITEVIEKISIKTRQFAKRQATWARGNMLDWNRVSPDDLNKFLKKFIYYLLSLDQLAQLQLDWINVKIIYRC